MIYDTLDHADLYTSVHPLLAEAFAFLKDFDPETPDGRIELKGEDMFVNVERYTTQPLTKRRYEAHRTYLDVQTIFTGREAIFIAPLGRVEEEEPYDAEKDVAFYSGTSQQLLDLHPGEFAIFLPQDAHKPVCQADGPSDVLKVVVKIKV